MQPALRTRLRRAALVCWRYLPVSARRVAIRLLYPQFPVGAVAIIRDARGQVLLVRQIYHRGETWGTPGGWVGRGESPRQAAAREALEELGLRVSVGRVLAIGTGPYGEVSLAFDCRVDQQERQVLDPEIDRAGFFPPDRLPPMPRATLRLVQDALAALDAR